MSAVTSSLLHLPAWLASDSAVMLREGQRQTLAWTSSQTTTKSAPSNPRLASPELARAEAGIPDAALPLSSPIHWPVSWHQADQSYCRFTLSPALISTPMSPGPSPVLPALGSSPAGRHQSPLPLIVVVKLIGSRISCAARTFSSRTWIHWHSEFFICAHTYIYLKSWLWKLMLVQQPVTLNTSCCAK